MPCISMRMARTADAARLATIGYRAWETGILPLLAEQPGMREAEQRRLARAIAEQIDRIVVAEVDGVVVAWCSRSARRAYIPYLFVLPELQSHGLGSILLRRMESMLELEGADRVHLETPADNVRAVCFYEKQGYRILAMRPNSRSAHDALMSVHLEKRLRPFVGMIADED